MQQYLNNNELIEPRFLAIKLPTLLLMTNVFIFQIIFHLSTATLTSVAAQQNLFSFEGLSKFTFDMWIIVILFSVGLFSYSKIQKQANLLLAVFLILPSIIILLALMRDVSFIAVTVLVSIIAFLICRFNYQRLSAEYLNETAKKVLN